MACPSLDTLCASLPKPLMVPPYHFVHESEVPEPFHQLLVHDRHMTTSMEAYHQCRVSVRVLQSQQTESWYSRQIILLSERTQVVVQGGIVRINLSMLDPEVQAAILREDSPLGHVLIAHDVLRHIEVAQYLKLEPGAAMHAWPGFSSDQPSYGRLGILYCDLQPAIELFELVPGG